MKLKNKRFQAMSERIINKAEKLGYDKSSIENCYVEDDLMKRTSSIRIQGFIECSYYKGIMKGIEFCDNLSVSSSKANTTVTDNNIEDLKEQIKSLENTNKNLENRLNEFNELISNLKAPPKPSGKLLSDGKAFVAFRNEYSKMIENAKKLLNEEK